MFDEQLFLEITFTDKARRAVLNDNLNTFAAATEYSINPVESKLIIDYITYPNETMEAWANANKNLSFQYTDYELSKFSVAQAAADSGIIRNIGGAGRVVNKVLMALSRDAKGTTDKKALWGNTEAIHPAFNVALNQNRVITNLRINQKGIELYQTISTTEDVASTMRVWIEVMKEATLVDGKLRSEYL